MRSMMRSIACFALSAALAAAQGGPGKCNPAGFVHVVPSDGGDKGLCDEIKYPNGEASKFWEAESWKYKSWKAGACDKTKFTGVKHIEHNYDGWTNEKNAGYEGVLCGDVVMTKYSPKSSTAKTAAVAAATVTSKHFIHPTEPHCEDLTGDFNSAWAKANSWRFIVYKSAGKCPSKYNYVNEQDQPFEGRFHHRTLGIQSTEVADNAGAAVKCGTGSTVSTIALRNSASHAMKIDWCKSDQKGACTTCVSSWPVDVAPGFALSVHIGADVEAFVFAMKTPAGGEQELWKDPKTHTWPSRFVVHGPSNFVAPEAEFLSYELMEPLASAPQSSQLM